jgi:hypothetical protein
VPTQPRGASPPQWCTPPTAPIPPQAPWKWGSSLASHAGLPACSYSQLAFPSSLPMVRPIGALYWDREAALTSSGALTWSTLPGLPGEWYIRTHNSPPTYWLSVGQLLHPSSYPTKLGPHLAWV